MCMKRRVSALMCRDRWPLPRAWSKHGLKNMKGLLITLLSWARCFNRDATHVKNCLRNLSKFSSNRLWSSQVISCRLTCQVAKNTFLRNTSSKMSITKKMPTPKYVRCNSQTILSKCHLTSPCAATWLLRKVCRACL